MAGAYDLLVISIKVHGIPLDLLFDRPLICGVKQALRRSFGDTHKTFPNNNWAVQQ